MDERSKIRNFKDLLVWQRSVKFVVRIYEVTRAFPREEMYGLTSQIRRSAISNPIQYRRRASPKYQANLCQFH